MAEPLPPAPPPDDGNLAPWERASEKPAAALPGGATTGWHDTRAKEKGKRSQIAAVVALFFALLGLLIGLFFWFAAPPRKVEMVAIPVSQYRSIAWGSNPTADRDADRLLAQFGQEGGRGSALQQGDKLRKLLDALHERDAKAPLVVFVSALAIVRDDKVFILPGDARIDAKETWVPLGRLLDTIAECPAIEKALILDIARTPADPFHGPLHDDVAFQVDKELAAFDPKFPVLCSCSPGERSLVIPELGLSAFAAFLAEGLSGEADGYPPSKQPNGQVSFAELAEFTVCRVSQWADQVQDARQMPKRYGPDGSGFLLFNRTRKELTDGESGPPPVAPIYPVELREAWKKRDEAKRDVGLMLAPDLVLELEALLLRTEDFYLAGFDVADPSLDPVWRSKAWETALQRLKDRSKILDVPPIKASLTELREGRKEPSKELIDALTRYMKARFPAKDSTGVVVPTKPADLEKLEGELEKFVQGDAALDGFWHLWMQLVTGTGLTAEKIANAVTVLDERFPPNMMTSERLLLRRLAMLPRVSESAYPDAVRSLLQCEQMFAEAVAATAGRLPQGFSRVRQLLTEGNDRKRDAEVRLFKPRLATEEPEAIRGRLSEALKKLTDARNGANSVREAHRAWADAAAQLHACLPGAITSDRPSFNQWKDADDLANKLAEQLSASDGPFASGDFETLDGFTRRLRAAMANLSLAPPDRIKTLDQDAQQRPLSTSLTELQKLLAGAALTAEERAMIAAGVRKVSAHRYHAARTRFDREPVMVPAKRPDPEKAFVRTERRANASIELLRLAGHRDADGLGAMARAASNDWGKWQGLSDRLRTEWSVVEPAAALEFDKMGRWMAVERIVRAAPARIDGFDLQRGFGELVRLEEFARRKWLAGAFSEYGKLREKVPGALAFYRERAEECGLGAPSGGR